MAAIFVGQPLAAQTSEKAQRPSTISLKELVMECLRVQSAFEGKQIIVWMPVENYLKQPNGERKIVAPTVVFVAAWEPDATAIRLAARRNARLLARDLEGETYSEIHLDGLATSAVLAYGALAASGVDTSILGDGFTVAVFPTFTKAGQNLAKEVTLILPPEDADGARLCRIPVSAAFTFVTDDPMAGAEFDLNLVDLNTNKEILAVHDRIKMQVTPPPSTQ